MKCQPTQTRYIVVIVFQLYPWEVISFISKKYFQGSNFFAGIRKIKVEIQFYQRFTEIDNSLFLTIKYNSNFLCLQLSDTDGINF